jgi:hypothetical protein
MALDFDHALAHLGGAKLLKVGHLPSAKEDLGLAKLELVRIL